ncbi:hypothetical protein GCM10009721_11440 [Terrabacter tumescens]|uniref:Uncharacterized protein n=2 Tax=Terrabacter tumescens TaxID=60443 RepID=A0ABQ2HPV0_9MICO|nr:hypothetical protein GCM10009721_11440 [Terrabacter tumescens]
MSVRFNAPPGWPVPSSSWAPGDDWMPDPSWPTPPRGWTFWIVDRPAASAPGDAGLSRFGTPPRSTAATAAPTAVRSGAYGTDRGSWLANLRARAASKSLVTATSSGPAAEPVRQRKVADSAWELDGLLASAGRLDL